MNFDRIARHDVHVSTLRTPLNCGQWNQTKIALGVYQEMSVHKLVGKETAVFIVEDGFQFVRSGGDINLVVDGKKFARRNFRRVVSIKGFDSELRGAFVKLVKNLRELILRKREDDRYGLQLRNDQEPVGVCGVNDVPGIDKTETNASGDGRCDARICQLKLGVVDLSLIGLDSAIELANGSGLRIELLLRNNAFLEEQLKALEVCFGVLALREVLGKLAFGLFQLNLERPGIDLREKIADFNVLALFKSDIDKLAIHATANGDRAQRSNGTEAVEINGKVAFGCRGYHNRNTEVCAPWAATRALTGRCRSRSVLRGF